MKARLAVASFVAAIVFALLAIFLPPLGQIDSSVNMLIAQLLLLAATLLGVESYYTKMKDMTISAGKKDH